MQQEQLPIELALDIIFGVCDELMLAGEFECLDDVLASLDGHSMLPEISLAWLTATRPAKEKLANRKNLVEQVRERLGQEATSLLLGLE